MPGVRAVLMVLMLRLCGVDECQRESDCECP
jgi:hypothetical protein